MVWRFLMPFEVDSTFDTSFLQTSIHENFILSFQKAEWINLLTTISTCMDERQWGYYEWNLIILEIWAHIFKHQKAEHIFVRKCLVLNEITTTIKMKYG